MAAGVFGTLMGSCSLPYSDTMSEQRQEKHQAKCGAASLSAAVNSPIQR